jgi:hypothetical protein
VTAASVQVERWLTCATKTCCSDYRVMLTGDDVVRIARMLDVEPWQFTLAHPGPADADDGYLLTAGGERYRLTLEHVKIGERKPTCTFLVQLTDGTARCGLAADRPRPCRLVSAGLCTCGRPDEPDATFELRERAELAEARVVYRAHVQRWNAFVSSGISTVYTHRDFCRFLLDAYEPVP